VQKVQVESVTFIGERPGSSPEGGILKASGGAAPYRAGEINHLYRVEIRTYSMFFQTYRHGYVLCGESTTPGGQGSLVCTEGGPI
jgi:hypothetical protein